MFALIVCLLYSIIQAGVERSSSKPPNNPVYSVPYSADAEFLDDSVSPFDWMSGGMDLCLLFTTVITEPCRVLS